MHLPEVAYMEVILMQLQLLKLRVLILHHRLYSKQQVPVEIKNIRLISNTIGGWDS